MAQIFIESRLTALENERLYLVFRDDNNRETVIGAGPTSNDPLNFGNLVVRADVPIDESQDRRIDEQGNPLSPEERNSTSIELDGRDGGAVWALMVQQALNIHAAAIAYNSAIENENAAIASVLDGAGIDINNSLPAGKTAADFPGIETALDFGRVLRGKRSNDFIVGGNGDDTLSGGDGRDTIEGGAGSDNLNGGNGDDTVRFADAFENYDFSISEDGTSIVVAHARGTQADGTDTLTDMELGQFGDRLVPLPLEDGPEDTEQGAIVDDGGLQLGVASLTMPVYMYDGDVEYTVTISSAGQGIQFNFAYIIDVSGSMDSIVASTGRTQLQEAQDAYIALTNFIIESEIASASQFAVIPFSSGASPLGPLSPTETIAEIEGLTAGGGTNFGPALNEAIDFFSGLPAGATNIAYFLSDGQGSGASDDLQAFADVRAFGIGDGVDIESLDIIDSNDAILLTDPSQLQEQFALSGVSRDEIAAINLFLEGTLVQTVSPDQLQDTPFGLSFTGSIDGLNVALDAENTIVGEISFADSRPVTTIEFIVTSGQGIGTPSDGDDDIRLGVEEENIDAGAGDDRIVANELDNEIEGGDGNDEIIAAGGDDLIMPGAGDDRIDAGDGIDTIMYFRTLAEEGGVSKVGDVITVGTNTDTITNAEFIQFADVRIRTSDLQEIPVLTVEDITVTEGNEGNGIAEFSFALSFPAITEVQFSYQTGDETATAGSDYNQLSGQLVIPEGESGGTLAVEVIGDRNLESDELFSLVLSELSGASFARNQEVLSVFGEIEDDDIAAKLGLAATGLTVLEGDGDTTALTFTVTRSDNTSGTTTVRYDIIPNGENPVDGGDFAGGVLPGETVTFNEGETEKEIAIAVAGDTEVERDEGLAIVLSDPSENARIVTSGALGTLENDDIPPGGFLSLVATDSVKSEGSDGNTAFTFTVTRSDNTVGETTVDYTVGGSGDNPADGADFEGGVFPSGTIVFADGETSRAITINVAGDAEPEGDEEFTFTLIDPSDDGEILTGEVTGTIENDDLSPKLAIVATDSVKPEGNEGLTPFTFTVTRSDNTVGETTADYTVSGRGDNPADGADFEGGVFPSGTIVFADGETSREININVSGENNFEADEGFTIALSNPSNNGEILTGEVTGTIENDDLSPKLAIAATDSVKPEGNEGLTPFTFTVTRSDNTVGETTADYTVSGSGDNPADGADFEGGVFPSGTIVFADGETTKEITVNVLRDNTTEADEGFALVPSNLSDGAELVTGEVTVTIEDDDLEDDDGDGIPNDVEELAGDRNGDGISDGEQANVSSVQQFDGDATDILTLVASSGAVLTEVASRSNPAPGTEGDPSATIDFPLGFLSFNIENIDPGDRTTISLVLPEGNDFNTYWKYSPELGWYEFLFDGETGAEFIDTDGNGSVDRLLLHFVDGQRGDNDGTIDGIVQDPGGPGVSTIPASLSATDRVFTIEGDSGAASLLFNLQSSSTDNVSEIGVFRVDENNRANGVAPDAPEFLATALTEAEVIFSGLSDRSDELVEGIDFTRQLQFSAGDRLVFYLVANGTTDGVLRGNDADVFFSSNELNPDGVEALRISQDDDVFNLAWEETPTDDSSFDDLVFAVQLQDSPPSLEQVIASAQGGQEAELIDLRQFVGRSVEAEFTSVRSEAAFDNFVGLYRVENERGTVIDPVTGETFDPIDSGYARAAVRLSQTIGQGVNFDRDGEFTRTNLEGGFLFAPFIIADGTPAEVLDGEDGADPAVYFAFLEGNRDAVDHVRLLGDNTFGFEDLPDGGDFDYNDIVFQSNFILI